MAKVVVKFVGSAREVFGPQVEVEVEEGTTVEQVIAKLVEENVHKAMGKSKEDVIHYLLQSKIVVNEEYSDASRKVRDGDLVTLITMAGGG